MTAMTSTFISDDLETVAGVSGADNPAPVDATPVSEPAHAAPTVETPADGYAPVVPDPARDESERLEPAVTGPVQLANGTLVDVVPLKLRETMKLLKIVTRGAGGVLEQLMGEFDLNDPAAFAQTFGALILLSIPEAENEVVSFVSSMVRPTEWDSLSAQERVSKTQALELELANPELEDVIAIVERIVRRESEDIRNLGKRLNQAFNLGRKVGELPAAS